MRLKFTFLLVLFALTLKLWATHVTIQDAKKVATAVLASKSTSPASFLSDKTNSYLSDGNALIYIFSIQPSGFIMISADNASYPLLAYSFESNYDESIQPENFSSWINGYADQINYAILNNIQPDVKTSLAWQQYLSGNVSNTDNTVTTSVSPLLTSTWDQGAPYNYLCPAAAGGSGGHVWAGCVATAMSQVLNYWRYPLQGNGYHGYYSAYGYLSADFGNTQYKWEEMTNSASGQNFQMAQLQSHLGISVDMMYSPSGSGAYSQDAANSLIEYFGMNPGLQLVDAPDPIDESWKSLLRGQLDQGYPMYYNGYGSGGHAFNVDGYNGNDYFHFNWGWSGSYNGYYYLDNLNPGGNNFTYGQGAIIDIYPASNYPYYCNSTDTLTSINGTVEDGSGPTGQYLGNAHCGWLISPDDSITSITLSFNRFDLENNHDYVTVYDGSDTTAAILGSFTGSDLPSAVSSSAGKMFIKFTSDNNGNSGGWLASYTAHRAVFCSGLTILTAPEGSLTDGSGTYNYHENALCKFKIMPDSAKSIVLTFNDFSTYDENDFLMIFNSENNELLYKLFGQQNPGTLRFNTGKLLLMFHTNNSDNAEGWSMDYSSSLYTGFEDRTDGSMLEVFPNPADHLLSVIFTNTLSQKYSIELMTMQGKSFYKSQPAAGQGRIHESLDLSGFEEGIYILRLNTTNGSSNQKVIIRH